MQLASRFLTILLLAVRISARPIEINQFSIEGINIDLPEEELALDEDRYFGALSNDFLSAASADVENINELVVKYESSSRKKFTAEKLNYIISRTPKSVVIFRDTNTILVPGDDILDSVSLDEVENKPYKYIELSIDEIVKDSQPSLEPPMIPASSCLSFSGKGSSGSIAFTYSSGVTIKNLGNTALNVKAILLGYTFGLGFSLQMAESFSGTHSCNTSNGNSVRLFYRVFSITSSARYKNILLDTAKSAIIGSDWMKMDSRKFLLTSLSPKFYCLTSDKADLKCEQPSVEYSDSNGNIIEGFIKGK